MSILFQPLSSTHNLKSLTLEALARIDIVILRDLLFYRPVNYQVKDISPNLSSLKDGQIIQTEIIIEEIILPKKRTTPIKILVRNETGILLLVFFNHIPPFIFNRLRIGNKHIISGKVQNCRELCQIIHPEFIFDKQQVAKKLEPIYPLTYGISNKQLYSYIIHGLDILARSKLKELDIVQKLLENLEILHLHNISIPENKILVSWESTIKRLAYQELLANQLLLNKVRNLQKSRTGIAFQDCSELKQKILNNLQLCPTAGQQQVIKEIEVDQQSPNQMMRLLQGDVGSGKTLVALLTIANVVAANRQAAIMAPTDILARQHYHYFCKALIDTKIKVALLTGNSSAKDRKQILTDLENGIIQILIGTHALFQAKVNFHDLSYIVIDEQHRFGVAQRLSLINKSSNPDLLIMTATPIPRSLALTVFGDMSISKLTSKPTNRLPVITNICPFSKLDEVINAMEKKIVEGKKIYWVCPLIEQKDHESSINNLILTDVHSRYDVLRERYGDKVSILHGKMSSEQKDYLMQRFSKGDLQILVSTTVIEVGIDVEDAVLIIIENAERFGLAQLHQLRGRVGRSSEQSYCIMLYNPKYLSDVAMKRLKIMRSSNDGFYIAEQDMVLRGSGDALGTKQSGEPEFFFADLARDLDILLKANELTKNITEMESIDFQIKLFSKNNNEFLI